MHEWIIDSEVGVCIIDEIESFAMRNELKSNHIVLFWWEITCPVKCEWQKYITSFQILKDEATREQYDYAIAHPEEVSRFSYG